jgi:cytochrome c biogenesis protein CcmG/thiol:disulfide interchange protein DsbE
VTLAQYRGKTVLINFWATWCPPCRAEMPAIDRVAGHDPRVVVLAVDVDEGPLLVQRYLQSTKLSFVPLLDEDGSVTGRYHVNGLPSSFFIGPDGTIRAINIGPMDQATVRLNLQRAS